MSVFSTEAETQRTMALQGVFHLTSEATINQAIIFRQNTGIQTGVPAIYTWQAVSNDIILAQMHINVLWRSGVVVWSSFKTYGKIPTDRARSTAQVPNSRNSYSNSRARKRWTGLKRTYKKNICKFHATLIFHNCCAASWFQQHGFFPQTSESVCALWCCPGGTVN